ncbi:MAG: hypothetical protein QXS21_05440 [Thermoproteota archaeon]
MALHGNPPEAIGTLGSLFSIDFRWLNPAEWASQLWTTIQNSLNSLAQWFWDYIIQPAWNAIQNAITWVWNTIVDFMNNLINVIWGFVNDWIVKPIYGFFQTVLNRVLEKLKGIVFILITFPIMIKEAKEIPEVEDLGELGRKLLFFGLKPIFGWITSEVVYALIRGYISPPTHVIVTPPTLPRPPTLPEFNEKYANVLDGVFIQDALDLVLYEKPLVYDVVNVNDYVEIGGVFSSLLNFSDNVGVNDNVIVELSEETGIDIGLSDAVSVNDLVSVSVGSAPPVSVFVDDVVYINDLINVSLANKINIGVYDDTIVNDNVSVELETIPW